MLRTSMEKMATYIGTKFGNEASQEWISSKRITPPEPAHSQAILDRHAARVRATKDRIELKLRTSGSRSWQMKPRSGLPPLTVASSRR